MRIRIQFQLFIKILIRVQLFTLMRIRIRLIKVMGICDYWSIVPPGLHCDCESLYVKLLNFDFNADPDPAFHSNADPDPASGFFHHLYVTY
jgi:hypothetical protein